MKNGKSEGLSTLDVLAKIIRIITVAPIMSLVLFTLMWLHGGLIRGVGEYMVSVIFLTVFPISAYPLQRALPPFRERGRDGQRSLAMIMANVGYALGALYALIFGASSAVLTLFLTYLMSGAALLVINRLFGFKASGHACGLVGPVTALAYYVSRYALAVGAILFAAVIWGSLRMKRHTLPQLIAGGIIPVAAFCFWILVL